MKKAKLYFLICLFLLGAAPNTNAMMPRISQRLLQKSKMVGVKIQKRDITSAFTFVFGSPQAASAAIRVASAVGTFLGIKCLKDMTSSKKPRKSSQPQKLSAEEIIEQEYNRWNGALSREKIREEYNYYVHVYSEPQDPLDFARYLGSPYPSRHTESKTNHQPCENKPATTPTATCGNNTNNTPPTDTCGNKEDPQPTATCGTDNNDVTPSKNDCKENNPEPKNVNMRKAPGEPTEKEGFTPPKKWDGNIRRHPITGQVGYPDRKGNIWVPTGTGPMAHGGPHWDVIDKDGRSIANVYPGGKIRISKCEQTVGTQFAETSQSEEATQEASAGTNESRHTSSYEPNFENSEFNADLTYEPSPEFFTDYNSMDIDTLADTTATVAAVVKKKVSRQASNENSKSDAESHMDLTHERSTDFPSDPNSMDVGALEEIVNEQTKNVQEIESDKKNKTNPQNQEDSRVNQNTTADKENNAANVDHKQKIADSANHTNPRQDSPVNNQALQRTYAARRRQAPAQAQAQAQYTQEQLAEAKRKRACEQYGVPYNGDRATQRENMRNKYGIY